MLLWDNYWQQSQAWSQAAFTRSNQTHKPCLSNFKDRIEGIESNLQKTLMKDLIKTTLSSLDLNGNHFSSSFIFHSILGIPKLLLAVKVLMLYLRKAHAFHPSYVKTIRNYLHSNLFIQSTGVLFQIEMLVQSHIIVTWNLIED